MLKFQVSYKTPQWGDSPEPYFREGYERFDSFPEALVCATDMAGSLNRDSGTPEYYDIEIHELVPIKVKANIDHARQEAEWEYAEERKAASELRARQSLEEQRRQYEKLKAQFDP